MRNEIDELVKTEMRKNRMAAPKTETTTEAKIGMGAVSFFELAKDNLREECAKMPKPKPNKEVQKEFAKILETVRQVEHFLDETKQVLSFATTSANATEQILYELRRGQFHLEAYLSSLNDYKPKEDWDDGPWND